MGVPKLSIISTPIYNSTSSPRNHWAPAREEVGEAGADSTPPARWIRQRFIYSACTKTIGDPYSSSNQNQHDHVRYGTSSELTLQNPIDNIRQLIATECPSTNTWHSQQTCMKLETSWNRMKEGMKPVEPMYASRCAWNLLSVLHHKHCHQSPYARTLPVMLPGHLGLLCGCVRSLLPWWKKMSWSDCSLTLHRRLHRSNCTLHLHQNQPNHILNHTKFIYLSCPN